MHDLIGPSSSSAHHVTPVLASPAAPMYAMILGKMNSIVVLGIDLAPLIAADLLGFAVRRVDLFDGSEASLKNPLKFSRAPYVGYQVAGTDTRQAPIQQLHWLDEAVQPDHSYRYMVTSVGGALAQPILRNSCDLSLHAALATLDDMALVFQRGITATPAYRAQFDTLRAAAAYLLCGLMRGVAAASQMSIPPLAQ